MRTPVAAITARGCSRYILHQAQPGSAPGVPVPPYTKTESLLLNTMRKQILAIAGLVLGAASLAACDFTGSSSSSPHLLIRLTDAPRAEIVAALVSIDRVEIKSSDSLSTVLTDSVQTFDLLALQDDSSIVLVDQVIPEGVYSQLRLIVGDEAVVTFDDATQQDLFIPSGEQTGIKILLDDVDLTSTEDTLYIMLDFDAEESFVFAGQSGKLLFKPVIKVKEAEVAGKQL